MGFSLLHIFVFLCLLLLARCDASPLSAEQYWRAKLPNTAMPEALQDLLEPDNGNMKTLADARTFDWNILYNIFNYRQAKATGLLQRHAISKLNMTIFFLYTDLHPKTKMNLLFTKSTNKATFLSRQDAESIPFSSDKLPEILKHFSVGSNSKEAEILRKTVEQCEKPSMEGEDKYCATSLESLVDFNIAKLGNRVKVFSTRVQEETNKKQEYTVSGEVQMVGDNAVICHKQRYAYAVFYCHAIKATNVLVVPLTGADGTNIEAVAVCHMDTSTWSPDHLAFQILKVKPGPPICHFPSSDTLVWVSN